MILHAVMIAMKPIEIVKTFQTPSVLMDAGRNVFEISGNSLPNNPHLFYLPILDWLDEYSEKSNPESKFEFRLSYLNSSSKKMFHEMMKVLERMHRAGKQVSVNWFYQPDDEDLFQAGMDIQKSFPFRVNCIPEEF